MKIYKLVDKVPMFWKELKALFPSSNISSFYNTLRKHKIPIRKKKDRNGVIYYTDNTKKEVYKRIKKLNLARVNEN